MKKPKLKTHSSVQNSIVDLDFVNILGLIPWGFRLLNIVNLQMIPFQVTGWGIPMRWSTPFLLANPQLFLRRSHWVLQVLCVFVASMKFFGRTMRKNTETSWNIIDHHETSWEILMHREIPWNIKNHRDRNIVETWGSTKHHETSRHIRKHQETSGNIGKHHETSWNMMKHHEPSWIMNQHEPSWTFMNH